MRSLWLVAMLVPLLILVGCAKKTVKNPAPSKDETAAVKIQPQPPAPAPADKPKNKKDDAPNWLNDPRWKKDDPKAPDEAKGDPLKKGWGITPPQGGWQPPSGPKPMPEPQPGNPPGPGGAQPGMPGGNQPVPVAPLPGVPAPPGMGQLQPQPVPPKPPAAPATAPKFSPVTEADMKEVWVFIENASGASGKMPAPVLTFQALIAGKSPAAALVKDGSIYLTGAGQRESVWAFETKAITDGGLVVSQNGVETLTAEQLRMRLGK